jgi:hypothetical protein
LIKKINKVIQWNLCKPNQNKLESCLKQTGKKLESCVKQTGRNWNPVYKQIWTCEFCNTDNNIDIMEEELPKEKDITFMLEPALSTTAAGPSGTDESLVIFCIDVSGSMCVTTEVSVISD